jgi:hypothetical protein
LTDKTEPKKLKEKKEKEMDLVLFSIVNIKKKETKEFQKLNISPEDRN